MARLKITCPEFLFPGIRYSQIDRILTRRPLQGVKGAFDGRLNVESEPDPLFTILQADCQGGQQILAVAERSSKESRNQVSLAAPHK